jgi:protein-disulfide isomerase
MAQSKSSMPVQKRERFDGGGMSPGVALVGFVLCFLAGAGLMWGYDQNRAKQGGGGIAAERPAVAWSDDESPIPVSSRDPVWGSRSAPVTIVVFSDFQCPFCSRVEGTVDQVKSTYGPDKVRVIWKNEPLSFHEKAKPAAEAAMAVFDLGGSEAFWKFHGVAFKNQQSLSPESYERWAAGAGVDPARFKAELASRRPAKKVDEDHELAKKVGVNGTPAFYVNGVALSGAQPFDKFKVVVDDELRKASAKLASGTPKDRLYVEASRENKRAERTPVDPETDSTTVHRVPIGTSPARGSSKALATIVVFSDFQCPFCKRVEPTLSSLRDKYGDKVRVVWKHEPLPFHPRAEPASELALEARAQKGDKGFWEAHDKLFERQPKLEDDDLLEIAAGMGLDVSKVKAAIKEKKHQKDIEADVDLADDVQASGTPHMFVNGRRIVGAQPEATFTAIIDEEIKKAEALLAKGTPADAIYDALQRDAKGPPEPEKKLVAVPAGNPSRGNPNAKVVIQEFSDYQCPFCNRVEEQVREIMKSYGDKVRLVWRDKPLPMHHDAPLAAQAAREAYAQKGPDAFWKMHDKLYEAQKREGGLKREALDGYAKELGLDMDRWRIALDTGAHKAAVDADDKAGTDAGITGTPAFVINGYFISGAQPYGKFKKLIDRALAESAKR